MKILVKQTDELKSTTRPNSTIVEEYLVYLMDETRRPLKCEIVYGQAAKNNLVNEMLVEFFVPNDWQNNKDRFCYESIVEEVSYEEYMNLLKIN